MDKMPLDLYYFAQPRSYQEFYIDEKGIDYMRYVEYEEFDKFRISTYVETNKRISKNLYNFECSIVDSDQKKINITKDIYSNLDDILCSLREESRIIYTYNNSQQLGDIYLVKFKISGNREACISVEKEYACVLTRYKLLLFPYKEDGSIDYSNLVKIIYVKEDSCVTLERNPSLDIFDNVSIEKVHDTTNFESTYSKFLKSNNTKCSILDFCPTVANVDIIDPIPNEIEINIKYNKVHLIKSMIRVGQEENLVVYTSSKGYKTSFHPHLFDPFNYKFIDEMYHYWAFDTYSYSKNTPEKKFTRHVVKIKNPEELIEYIRKYKDQYELYVLN